eukprot:TRINITY_DN11723_c0_g1_i1.p1 TRINITY_DN11723_c0_g1~~TRINITY_DN11723_c0_g1_i1.p1  ORF type:complete len:105 (+),score=32.07 TRINITY_DN11723_c0_g1_i1:50-364(+)
MVIGDKDAEAMEGEKSQKELDEEIKKKKERQVFLDDVGVLVAMVTISIIAIVVVLFKVILFQPQADDIITTFYPIPQMESSKIKYTGNGFIPCSGYVPCNHNGD